MQVQDDDYLEEKSEMPLPPEDDDLETPEDDAVAEDLPEVESDLEESED
jgi:hypothetical protein